MALLAPWRRAREVEDIDPAALVAAGVRCVLLDRDNTLVPLGARTVPPDVAAWVGRVREAGLATCIVSNNFLSRDLARTGRELGCPVVDHAMKPAPFAVWAALRRLGATVGEAVLVGDQLFTDVLAGNLAGVRTILVEPQARRDLWYARPFRWLERRLLRGGRG